MKSQQHSASPFRLSVLGLLVAPAALLAACSDTINNEYRYYYYGEGGADAGGETGAAGDAGKGGSKFDSGGAGGEAGTGQAGSGGMVDEFPVDPKYPDAPKADTHAKDLMLDLFGTVGNRYWFGVQQSQVDQMNGGDGGICPFCRAGDVRDPAGGDYPYTPGGSGSATYVDHLWVTTAGAEPRTADFGKVQVKVAGQSTRRPWDAKNIPNLNIDADQFVKDQRIAGYEHLRFNNGQVGTIFREHLANKLYRELGYPAPLSTYAWVSSNVWGADVAIPYILVERYKQAFCKRYETEFGGGCTNMWEFVGGDFNGNYNAPEPGEGEASLFDDPNNCQLDKCESTRVKELEAKLRATPRGDGFKAALSEFIDWPMFHRFQCLSYVLTTGDDVLHNQNNIVLVERADGKFQYLPYSIDISLGQSWYPYTPLPASTNMIAGGCQSDNQCWADTIAVCESVISDLRALKPNELLKGVYDELEQNGMLRDGDDVRYQYLDTWFTDWLARLPTDLEQYREPQVSCQKPLIDCNGECKTYEECYGGCIPANRGLGLAADADPGAGGAFGGGGFPAGGAGPDECPKVDNYAVAE